MGKVIQLGEYAARKRSENAACEGRAKDGEVTVHVCGAVATLSPEQARTWAHGLLTLADTAEAQAAQSRSTAAWGYECHDGADE